VPLPAGRQAQRVACGARSGPNKERDAGKDMVAYEFYWRDEIGRDHLIGLIPERRRRPERITPESVSKWVRTFLDDIADFDFNTLHIIRRELKFTNPSVD